MPVIAGDAAPRNHLSIAAMPPRGRGILIIRNKHGRGTMPRNLPTMEHDGFCLLDAADPAPGVAPGALAYLQFQLGFVDQHGKPFTHHQSLWVVITAQRGRYWLGTLLEAPFLFLNDENELLTVGTELPFLPCHVAELLHEADLGPGERKLARRPAQRRWAA